MRASIYLSQLFFDRRHRLLSQYFYLCRLLFFFQINNNRRLNKLELALALGLALASLILITTFLPRIIHAWSTKFSTFVWCELIEQRMFNNMKKNILWDSPVSRNEIPWKYCRWDENLHLHAGHPEMGRARQQHVHPCPGSSWTASG